MIELLKSTLLASTDEQADDFMFGDWFKVLVYNKQAYMTEDRQYAEAVYNTAVRYVRRGADAFAAVEAARQHLYAREDPLRHPFFDEIGENYRVDNARWLREINEIIPMSDVEIVSLMARLRSGTLDFDDD